MVFDAQNGPQLVIRGISTALKMLNLPPKHPFFTFEAKKPLKQRVGAHFEHQKSFIYIKTWFFVLWLYSNSFNEGPTPYGIKRANLLCTGHSRAEKTLTHTLCWIYGTLTNHKAV